MMRHLILTICFAGLSILAMAQAKEFNTDAVAKAIRAADSRSLADHFNATIDIKLPDAENKCSSSQGEMIVRDFFKKYPPKSFTIIRQGSTGSDSRFAIGEYLSGSIKYQVFLNFKITGEKFLIHEMKFEATN